VIRCLLTSGARQLAHYGRNDGDTAPVTPFVTNVRATLEDGGEFAVKSFVSLFLDSQAQKLVAGNNRTARFKHTGPSHQHLD